MSQHEAKTSSICLLCNTQFFSRIGSDWGTNKYSELCSEWNWDWSPYWVLDKRVPRVKAVFFFCTWNKQTSSFILLFSSLTLRRLTYYDLCFIYRFHVAFEHLIVCGMSTASGQLFFLQTVLSLLERASRYSASKIHNTYTYNECSKITCYIVVWLLNVIAQSFFVLLFSVVSSKDTLWRLWSCIVEHLNEHIQKVSSHLS